MGFSSFNMHQYILLSLYLREIRAGLYFFETASNLFTPISWIGKEQQTPFIADIDALIPLKFPGPVQTTILLISCIFKLFLFKKSERKKKFYQNLVGLHFYSQKTHYEYQAQILYLR